MKQIFVNIEKQKVTVDNQSCNFYEAGLIPNGVVLSDPEEIKEALLEWEEIGTEVIFEI